MWSKEVAFYVLYLLYTSDIFPSEKITVATYADNKAIIVWNLDGSSAMEILQEYLYRAQDWILNFYTQKEYLPACLSK